MAGLPGHPDIEITLRRSARARRFSLRVSRLDGSVTLTLPARAREAEGLAFARDRAEWIRDARRLAPALACVGLGAEVPVEGIALRVVQGTGRVVARGEGILAVPGPAETAGRRVEAYLKVLARDRLQAACDHHSARLGRAYASLTLRDTRSRWGSCTAKGALNFSWRLAMAPPQVLDYVAAHEVAHLQEMNHAPAYWAVLGRLMPGYEAPRAWLKRHGATLHALRFQ